MDLMGWAGVRELKESSLRPQSDSETRLHRVQEETSREEIKLTDRRPTWSGSLTGKGKEIEKAVVSKGWEAGGSSQVCATVWSGGRGGVGSEHSQGPAQCEPPSLHHPLLLPILPPASLYTSASSSCPTCLPYLPALAMDSCGPSFLSPIPVIITSSGCVGRSPTCIYTPVGGREGAEKRNAEPW